MLKIIVCLIIGYFIGMVSCLIQVLHMENKHDGKIGEILDGENDE